MRPVSPQGYAQEKEKTYAVIYGASNKAGKAFAFYLMQKGFNLILIERDAESLQGVEDLLRKMLPEKTNIIVRIVISKYDQDSISNSINRYSTFPIKIFVNCKSSKKTFSKAQLTNESFEEKKQNLLTEPAFQNYSDSQLMEVIQAQEEISSFEISTRAEIHFTGQENVQAFASLVNIFLRAMLMTSQNPCLINVDNEDDRSASF